MGRSRARRVVGAGALGLALPVRFVLGLVLAARMGLVLVLVLGLAETAPDARAERTAPDARAERAAPDARVNNVPRAPVDTSSVHIYLPPAGRQAAADSARTRHTIVGLQPWYSRADGMRIALTASHPFARAPLTASAALAYSPVRDAVLGGLGARVTLSRARGVHALLSATRWTSTHDGMQLDPLDDALRAVLLTRESYDYFGLDALRTGVVLDRGPHGSATLDLRSDRYRTLTMVARRGLLTTPHDFRANPAIDDGREVLLRASFLRDTRDTRDFRDVRDSDSGRAPASWERVVIEHADRAWGGDFTFSRAEVELGVRSPLSPATRLDYRMRAGAGSATMPAQQRFFAGGDGTLRGYPVKAAGGNALLLLSAEATTDITPDIRALAFADAGTAWQDWNTLGSQKILVSAGVGVGLGGQTRAYLARAWSAPGQPWSVRVVLRSAFARPTAGLDAVQP